MHGGYSSMSVGSIGMRESLAEPVDGKVFFAGEATQGMVASVHSAMCTGVRAAGEVLKLRID